MNRPSGFSAMSPERRREVGRQGGLASPHTKSDAYERAMRKIEYDTNGGCWLWGGQLDCNGYGRIKVNCAPLPAHIFMWRHSHGDIPAGLFVLHNCDNPACVNPGHLRLGTHQDNMDDVKKRQRSGHGGGGAPRLDYAARDRILSLLAEGRSQRSIAVEFGVSPASIRYWRDRHGPNIARATSPSTFAAKGE